MRLKTEIWAMAHVRRAFAEGAMAVIAQKGDRDAGAIFIHTVHGDGSAALYGPAPQPDGGEAGERYWRLLVQEAPAAVGWLRDDRGGGDGTEIEPGPGREIETRLARETRFDPDIWVVEIEDREGRHFLGQNLVPGDI